MKKSKARISPIPIMTIRGFVWPNLGSSGFVATNHQHHQGAMPSSEFKKPNKFGGAEERIFRL
jgi:hypothetical protein